MSPAPLLLVDTSAWKKNKHARVKPWFDQAALNGEIAICDQVVMELFYEPTRAADYRRLAHALSGFTRIPMIEHDWLRAREVQTSLAALGHGEHKKVKIADLLIAAAAERAGLILVHYDQDFDDIAGVTGQSTQWIGPRGEL